MKFLEMFKENIITILQEKTFNVYCTVIYTCDLFIAAIHLPLKDSITGYIFYTILVGTTLYALQKGLLDPIIKYLHLKIRIKLRLRRKNRRKLLKNKKK